MPKKSSKKMSTAKKTSSKKTTSDKRASKNTTTKKRAAKSKTKRVSPALKERAERLYGGLVELFPTVECALDHKNAFELLVATILSAQCTDERVNKVTPALFKQFPTAQKMSQAPIETIEKLIHSTGFYRNKAKSIKGMSTLVVEKHGGEIPDTMDELLKLPGVARKTANVLLGTWFKKNIGVVVDTHVKRLSNRMGLTTQTQPEKVEGDLMVIFPQEEWTNLSHRMIYLGRSLCPARKPKCEECPLQPDCKQVGV